MSPRPGRSIGSTRSGYTVEACSYVRDLLKERGDLGVDIKHGFTSYGSSKPTPPTAQDRQKLKGGPGSVATWPPTPTARRAIAWHLAGPERPEGKRVVFHEILLAVRLRPYRDIDDHS